MGSQPEVSLRALPYAPTYGVLQWASRITTRYHVELPAVFVTCATKEGQDWQGRRVEPERIQLVAGTRANRIELTLGPRELPAFRALGRLEGSAGRAASS